MQEPYALKLILAGELPYGIYVRWKKPHEQFIGSQKQVARVREKAGG